MTDDYDHYALDQERAPRMYPGWMALFNCLLEAGGIDALVAKPDVVLAILNGSDLAARTCRNMVNEAVRKEWVIRITGGTGKSTFLRLSPEGLAVLRNELIDDEGDDDMGSGRGDGDA